MAVDFQVLGRITTPVASTAKMRRTMPTDGRAMVTAAAAAIARAAKIMNRMEKRSGTGSLLTPQAIRAKSALRMARTMSVPVTAMAAKRRSWRMTLANAVNSTASTMRRPAVCSRARQPCSGNSRSTARGRIPAALTIGSNPKMNAVARPIATPDRTVPGSRIRVRSWRRIPSTSLIAP